LVGARANLDGSEREIVFNALYEPKLFALDLTDVGVKNFGCTNAVPALGRGRVVVLVLVLLAVSSLVVGMTRRRGTPSGTH